MSSVHLCNHILTLFVLLFFYLWFSTLNHHFILVPLVVWWEQNENILQRCRLLSCRRGVDWNTSDLHCCSFVNIQDCLLSLRSAFLHVFYWLSVVQINRIACKCHSWGSWATYCSVCHREERHELEPSIFVDCVQLFMHVLTASLSGQFI